MCGTVALGLSVVEVCAVALAAGGHLLATPMELLTSLALALATCVGVNRLCALAWRAPRRDMPSVVTALVLALVAWPVNGPTSAAALVLASVVAVASKYVLVFRGRRLANPAALGLLAASIAGWGSGSWWVATPLLLPVVALIGLVIVWRSGTWAPALAALSSSWIVLVVRLVLNGESLPGPAWSALASYPLVFLSAIMVTDTQLLAPRRRQQVLVAVITGILLGWPLALVWGDTSWSVTPEVAVLAGNLATVALTRARGAHGAANVLRSRALAPGVVEVELRSSRPIEFEPGQFLELTVPTTARDPHEGRRVFSLVDAPQPGGSHVVSVIFRTGESPSLPKQALVRAGDDATPQSECPAVRIEGVRGDFRVPPGDAPLLLVASGVGITPFLSYARSLRTGGGQLERVAGGHEGDPLEQGQSCVRDITLIHRVRTTEEVIAPEDLAPFRVVVVTTDKNEAGSTRVCDERSGWSWMASSTLDTETLLAAVPDLRRRTALVSGPPAMVREVASSLRHLGVRGVHTEAFPGV